MVLDAALFSRLPKHIGIIPDGNRRWAENNGMARENGYKHGIDPGLQLYHLCRALGIEELTYYGFTQDNTKRPGPQKVAFKRACIEAVKQLASQDASLRVIGDSASPSFPKELLPFTERVTFGTGSIKINFLVNYGWQWDLRYGLGLAKSQGKVPRGKMIQNHLASSDVSRLDLIIRWGGRRRLSGFLPVQSIYSDFYIIDEYWPDFRPDHLFEALRWFETQDITLGG